MAFGERTSRLESGLRESNFRYSGIAYSQLSKLEPIE